MAAYYNENDPFAAQWLRNLIAKNLIAPGDVDERSIEDVRPDDLHGYKQCHFFAGIGGWSYALRLAGWPDDEPVWTGSCPCQPFSVAGKRNAHSDERHLWPVWQRLISSENPSAVFGEQVETAVKDGWLDLVFADLEAENYTCGAAVLGAHSVGAPHVRQRLYWIADAGRERQQRFISGSGGNKEIALAPLDTWDQPRDTFADWRKFMATAGTLRLADGISSCVEVRPALHAYGNAIVPQVAAEFIGAYMDVRGLPQRSTNGDGREVEGAV